MLFKKKLSILVYNCAQTILIFFKKNICPMKAKSSSQKFFVAKSPLKAVMSAWFQFVLADWEISKMSGHIAMLALCPENIFTSLKSPAVRHTKKRFAVQWRLPSDLVSDFRSLKRANKGDDIPFEGTREAG